MTFVVIDNVISRFGFSHYGRRRKIK